MDTNGTSNDREEGDLENLTGILSLISLIAVQFGIACSISFEELAIALRTRKTICFGLFSQIVVMPLTAFILATAFNLNEFQALALVLLGSCPGGTLSNIFTFFAKGDVALSLAMTSLTNILAFITLPINLLMYTKPFRSSDVETPYIDILKSLLTVVLSIALGLVTRAKSERLAKIGVKIGSILGAITVVIIIVAGVVENFDAFSDPEVFPWTTPVVCAIMGPVAFLWVFSWSFCLSLNQAQRITLMLETGVQSIPLALAVTQLSFGNTFDSKELFIMEMLLSTYGLFTGIYGFVLTMLNRYCWSQTYAEAEEKEATGVADASETSGDENEVKLGENPSAVVLA